MGGRRSHEGLGQLSHHRPWPDPRRGWGKNWYGQAQTWDAHLRRPKGRTFWDTYFELVPEAIVLEADPTGYPLALDGKKRVWLDARNMAAPN
jgi:hypothetical protein